MKNYEAAMDPAHDFIGAQGRLKYLTPIYKALKDSGQRATAVQWFNEHINFYHPLAVASLKKLLGITDEPERVVKVVNDQPELTNFLQ